MCCLAVYRCVFFYFFLDMLNEEDTIVREGVPNFLKPKKVTKAQKAFLQSFLADKQQDFEEVMEELKLMSPRRWAELYVDMTKLVIPKQQNVNVNVGINRDFRELHMLATTRVGQKSVDGGSVRKLERLEAIEDVDYEEIPKEESYADY